MIRKYFMHHLIAAPLLESYVLPAGARGSLAIILVGHDSASELYVAIKQKQAAKYNITTQLIRLPETSSTQEVCDVIERVNTDHSIHAMIVQLPLPEGIATERVLDTILPTKDVDNLTGQNCFVSPMVQAVSFLVEHYGITLKGKTACVIGQGRLVGQPITQWLRTHGIEPVVIDETTTDRDSRIQAADIVFAGAGQPLATRCQRRLSPRHAHRACFLWLACNGAFAHDAHVQKPAG